MKTYLLLFALLFSFVSISVQAQINVRGKLKDQSINRADNKVDQGIDKGLDAVETGVKDLFKKKKETGEEEPAIDTETDDQEAQEEEPEESVAKPAGTPLLQSYSKFDFTPGEKVIFYDDFSQDAVGDIPALWFSSGSGEVVKLNNYPGNWMSITSPGCYYPEIDLKTTENFTAEFDMVCNFVEGESFNVGFYLVAGNIKDPSEGGAIPGVAGVKTVISPWDVSYSGYSEGEYRLDGTNDYNINPGEKIHISYWIQKQRLRIYFNEKKVIDAPRAIPSGYQYNILRFEIDDSKPILSNFRVAAGLPDTRNKLMAEGKLVTYGIYFDVNKDVVKPESYGTLKDIAAVLNEVPEVKVRIFGHTDADGEDAKNMDLSKRRAASVKAELAKSFGVNGDRLETDGLGETKPVAPNDSPANKAMNRRVEFIKL